jgi:hypothetical protein
MVKAIKKDLEMHLEVALVKTKDGKSPLRLYEAEKFCK